MTSRVCPVFVLLAVLLAACATPEDLDPKREQLAAPIVTDRERYALEDGPYGPETTIVTTFTAPEHTAVYLMNCNGAFSPGLQRRDGDAWVDAWVAEINSCLSPPIVIAPGEQHTGTMTVASRADAEVESRKSSSRIEAGMYRAVWHGLFTSFDPDALPFGEELPLDYRVSGPFPIEAATPRDPSKTSPAVRPAEIISVEPVHASVVGGSSPVRVRFSLDLVGLRLSDPPRLYVDGRDVTEEVKRRGRDGDVELEVVPERDWPPGRHEARVVYVDDRRKTHWYAWSFMVTR